MTPESTQPPPIDSTAPEALATGLRAPSIEERWATHYDMCCWGWRDPPDYEPEMETTRQLMLATLEDYVAEVNRQAEVRALAGEPIEGMHHRSMGSARVLVITRIEAL